VQYAGSSIRISSYPVNLTIPISSAHHRRHAIHFNVTAHPTAEWTAQQIVEAFPWDSAPRYLFETAFTAHRSISELGKWAFAKC
jgi:hypothetical protein